MSTTSPAGHSSTASGRRSWSQTGSWWSASTGGAFSAGSTAQLPTWCTTGSTSPDSQRRTGPWPRRCGGAELPAWYTAADVLAFPSTKEGWGLAVLEALSAGLPVVASDLPVFREYLRPGRDAMLVPADDPPALATALAAVLDDRRLAGRLRLAGRMVAAGFSWARSAAEHQAIYAAVGRTQSGARSYGIRGAAADGQRSHPGPAPAGQVGGGAQRRVSRSSE